MNYQRQSGVNPGYVRLAVGIKHFEDVIADIKQALAAAKALPLIFPGQNMNCSGSCSSYFIV
jgi:hypothetical protein